MAHLIDRAQEIVDTISCPVSNRYRSTIFKSKDLEEMKLLYKALRDEYVSYECWDSKVSGCDLTQLSRMEAVKKLKSTKADGVLLYLPEEWQFDWGLKDKHAFLSSISMFSGAMPHVVLLYKDSEQFNAANTHYFKKYTSLSKDCDVLLSNRAELVTKAL